MQSYLLHYSSLTKCLQQSKTAQLPAWRRNPEDVLLWRCEEKFRLTLIECVTEHFIIPYWSTQRSDFSAPEPRESPHFLFKMCWVTQTMSWNQTQSHPTRKNLIQWVSLWVLWLIILVICCVFERSMVEVWTFVITKQLFQTFKSQNNDRLFDFCSFQHILRFSSARGDGSVWDFEFLFRVGLQLTTIFFINQSFSQFNFN